MLKLTLYHTGDRSVGIGGDAIVVEFPDWMIPMLDSPENTDEQNRTWRQQLEQDTVKLYEPFMDFPLRTMWSTADDFEGE